MQGKRFDPSVNPLYSPIVGTVPLPGTPTSNPVQLPYNSPVQGSHLGLYSYTSPSPAPSSHSSSASSSSSHRGHHSHAQTHGHNQGHAHHSQLSPLASPPLQSLNTTLPSPTHAYPTPQHHYPGHAHTTSKSYPTPHPHHPQQVYAYAQPAHVTTHSRPRT